MKAILEFFKRLFSAPVEKQKQPDDWAPWMKIVEFEIGVKEGKGSKNNPRIVEYHQAVSLKATQDSVPWCSSFVNWIFMRMNMTRTKSALAISWLDWGVELEEPIYGAVMVDDYKNGHGHVAFFTKRLSESQIEVLGGNQNDEVCYKAWRSNVRFFWPKGEPLPSHAKLKNKTSSKAA